MAQFARIDNCSESDEDPHNRSIKKPQKRKKKLQTDVGGRVLWLQHYILTMVKTFFVSEIQSAYEGIIMIE